VKLLIEWSHEADNGWLWQWPCERLRRVAFFHIAHFSYFQGGDFNFEIILIVGLLKVCSMESSIS